MSTPRTPEKCEHNHKMALSVSFFGCGLSLKCTHVKLFPKDRGVQHPLQPETRKSFKNSKPGGLDPAGPNHRIFSLFSEAHGWPPNQIPPAMSWSRCLLPRSASFLQIMLTLQQPFFLPPPAPICVVSSSSKWFAGCRHVMT